MYELVHIYTRGERERKKKRKKERVSGRVRQLARLDGVKEGRKGSDGRWIDWVGEWMENDWEGLGYIFR